MSPEDAAALQAAYDDFRRCYYAELQNRLGPFAEQSPLSTASPDQQDREAD